MTTKIPRHAGRAATALAIAAGFALITGCGTARTPSQDADSHAHDAARSGTPAAEEATHDEHGAHEGEDAGAQTDEAMELTPEAIANAHLGFGVAGPREIAVRTEAPGEVHLNAERVLEVRPRYSGVVRELRRRQGDRVSRGDVVAVVQNSESLAEYEIRATLAGTVISRPAIAGQSVNTDTPLMTIADLSSVWVDFSIFPQFVGRVREGTPVRITAAARPDLAADGRVGYVGPLLEQDTRIATARVVLPNPRGDWPPGLFVSVDLELEHARVPVAVPEDAVLRAEDGAMVFVARGSRFEPRTVVTGRTDGRLTEIVSGLTAGDSVVTRNAFVLKSELGKREVSHGH